ncbi:MAG: DedA family protein [Candidatus Abyssobacteria bacterium SURF_5]|uniref:DedA family protein n=1 Tax=Abyssobacteria bacterium (strain SURF_5) TaxID=2093360 RepID=A0A3A4NS27_ABYX5|nr:MAG: DedA family protein [Candidatus Abyssubacteria bacterium SURF_5]
MELIKYFFDIILHLDKHLDVVIKNFGNWTYAIFFCIIFFETGVVVTPFLPGDSLLFAVGALAALGSLDVKLVLILLIIAAIAGDTANYWIGHAAGPKVFTKTNSRFLNKEHLDRTHRFYEKYGGKTIVLARFIPIIRTFAPFVAGIGSMNYRHFIVYNVLGGTFWVLLFVLGGYFFGNMPVVKNNFSLVIFAIIFISILPGIIEFVRSRRKSSDAVAERAACPED